MKNSMESDRRSHARKPVNEPAYIRVVSRLGVSASLELDRRWRDCRIVNISPGGAKVIVTGPSGRGKSAHLKIARFGRFTAAVVWRAGSELGLRFDHNQEKIAEVILGLAVYG